MTTTAFNDDESRWQAVQARTPEADGAFVFAVKTTGIYCRPTCRSRRALRLNVAFYPSPTAAEAAGFRPCKRCQPQLDDPLARQKKQVEQACRILDSSESALSLQELAQQVAISPWYFHRLFKQTTGLTPKAWHQARRAEKMRQALQQGESVTGALYQAGYASASSFYHQADNTLGMTARQYRHQGEQAAIEFVVGRCSLGEFLVAGSERGICAIAFGDSPQDLIASLEQQFPRAAIAPGSAAFADNVAGVVSYLDHQQGRFPLPLDLQGTAFQIQVWRALQTIPAGETASYQHIATAIGKPDAVRAVAGACAANKLAVVIPCHRVIRRDGALSGYRWGVERKRALLQREAEGEGR